MIFLVLVFLVNLVGKIEGGTHLDKHWFRWKDGRVPFYFQNMENADRRVIRTAMKSIERKTCLRFEEEEGPLSGHHLVVKGSQTSCLSGPGGVPTFSAAVAAIPPANKQVVLQSYFQVADSQRCVNESRGGLLHELFHVFGVMHTQKRTDRDRYVRVLRENIMDQLEYSYDICEECKDYGIPYDCDSIMHSGTETFSTGKPTMERKDQSCDLRWVGAAFDGRHGSEIASKWDWELLRRIASKLCSSTTGKNKEEASQIRTTSKPKMTRTTKSSAKVQNRRNQNRTKETKKGGRTTPSRPEATRKPKANIKGTSKNTSSKKLKPSSRQKELPAPWRRRPTSKPK